MSPLLRAAAVLAMLAFAVQGLSTSAKRLWAPSHYHQVTYVPATLVPAALADPSQSAGPVPGQVQASEHGHDEHVQDTHSHDQGDPQADAAALAWAQANAAGAASRFNHGSGFDFHVGGTDSIATDPAIRDASPPGNAVHQHATGSGHTHDTTQRGVVYVDAGAHPQAPAATTAGFDAYWSIVPPARLETVLRRPHAPPPQLTQFAQASRLDGPPERPPRG